MGQPRQQEAVEALQRARVITICEAKCKVLLAELDAVRNFTIPLNGSIDRIGVELSSIQQTLADQADKEVGK